MVDTPTEDGARDAGRTTAVEARPLVGPGDRQIAPTAALTDGDRPRVDLPRPPDGQSELVIQAQPGADLVVQFDPASANLSLEGADLVFQFEDGTRTVLQGFAAADPQPNILLPDGTILAGGIVVAELVGAADVLNLETAAGPQAGQLHPPAACTPMATTWAG